MSNIFCKLVNQSNSPPKKNHFELHFGPMGWTFMRAEWIGSVGRSHSPCPEDLHELNHSWGGLVPQQLYLYQSHKWAIRVRTLPTRLQVSCKVGPAVPLKVDSCFNYSLIFFLSCLVFFRVEKTQKLTRHSWPSHLILEKDRVKLSGEVVCWKKKTS